MLQLLEASNLFLYLFMSLTHQLHEIERTKAYTSTEDMTALSASLSLKYLRQKCAQRHKAKASLSCNSPHTLRTESCTVDELQHCSWRDMDLPARFVSPHVVKRLYKTYKIHCKDHVDAKKAGVIKSPGSKRYWKNLLFRSLSSTSIQNFIFTPLRTYMEIPWVPLGS